MLCIAQSWRPRDVGGRGRGKKVAGKFSKVTALSFTSRDAPVKNIGFISGGGRKELPLVFLPAMWGGGGL